MARWLLAVSFLFLFSLSFSSAVLFDNPDLPIVKPDPTSLPSGNVTVNISVNSSSYWDTSDRGALGAVSDISHNWFSGLQGGSAGQFYHLTSSVYTTLNTNINDWITLSQALNLHDQNLNTTDAVIFNGVNISCSGLDGANESCLNVSGDIYARDVHARDVYVSNNTLYIGDTVSLSANGVSGSVLNISGGNVSVGSTGYYFGSGQFLTDINASQINYTETDITTEGNITASNYTGDNFFGGTFTGLFNFFGINPWLSSNQTHMTFNESKFNVSVQDLAGISQREESLVVATSGGSASASTAGVLGFYLKRITVVPTNPTDQYRFEAVASVSGDMIDRNRKLHTGTWDIVKDISIDEGINISITNANPDSTYNITFKYLSQNF